MSKNRMGLDLGNLSRPKDDSEAEDDQLNVSLDSVGSKRGRPLIQD